MDCRFLLVQGGGDNANIARFLLQFGILITMQLLFLVGQCGEPPGSLLDNWWSWARYCSDPDLEIASRLEFSLQRHLMTGNCF